MALNRYATNAQFAGNGTACNFTEYGWTQVPSADAACSAMLLQAGPLGENTVTSSNTAVSSSSLNPSSSNLSVHAEQSGLATGSIVGIVIGILIFLCGIGGFFFLLYRRKFSRRKLDVDADGLEVVEGPKEVDHVRNVELEAPPPEKRSELWASTNTHELGDTNDKSKNPSYHNKIDPSSEETTEGIIADPKQDSTEVNPEPPELRLPDENGRMEAPPNLDMSPSWHGGIWFDPSRQMVYTAIPSNAETDDR